MDRLVKITSEEYFIEEQGEEAEEEEKEEKEEENKDEGDQVDEKQVAGDDDGTSKTI